MEWEMKMPSWDLAELERDAAPNIGSMTASSSSGIGFQKNGLDCSVDLKLGGLGDLGSSWKDQSRVSAASVASLPPYSSKRARAPTNASQNVSCLVDGCMADLSNCRDYHRRHKVCEAHSKTPMVLVGGQEQRFCQQCSRFHLLVEFDEVKRSCRKRLDGHNRRRRKPQPESMSSANFITNLQGPSFSSYPQVFPTATSDPNRSSLAKNGETALYRQDTQMHFIDGQHFPSSYSSSLKEGKHFPFLQDTDAAISSRTTIETCVCQPLLNTISFSESSGSSSKIFSNGLTQVLDSDCALSLLSSRTQTPGIYLDHMLSADRIPTAQPLFQTLQPYGDLGRYSRSQASNNVSPTGFSCSGMGNEHVGTIMVSDATNVDIHCHGLFHVGGDGPSGASTALPFSWH